MSSRKRARGSRALRPENEPEWLDDSQVDRFGDLMRVDTKTKQLCRQVEEAIACALACSTSPILRDLYVAGVEAAKGAAMLRVLVTMERNDDDCQKIREALARAKGYLAREVARSIQGNLMRDKRTKRDLHALDQHGMVTCNPRDLEAAHRAEVEGIATENFEAVTCRKCRERIQCLTPE